MNLTEKALSNSRVTAVAIIIIIIGGLSAYLNLPQAEDPGFTVRKAMVKTFFPGASPERVETFISDKIEKAILEIPEVDYVESTSRTGLSLVFIELKPTVTNLRPVWDNLRRKVEATKSSLPNGSIGPFVNDEYGEVFGIVLSVSSDGSFSYKELKEIADEIRDEFLKLKEVAKVEIFGDQEEQVILEYDNAKLSKTGMPPGQLAQILESQNIIIPGGSITVGSERIVLEPSGNFSNISEIKKTVLSHPETNETYFLEDFVDVKMAYPSPPRTKSKSSGNPALSIAVSLREGGNIITLGEEIKETVAAIKNAYPIGVNLDFVSFQPEDVKRKVDDFVSNVLQSIVIVVLVMLIALGFRTGFLVSSLIPLSMLMSLLLMNVLDIGLDQVSLAALIIALGMLVDNAIVMAESIMVMVEKGKSIVSASINSAKELKVPLLTSSLTTIAAFLPIYLAESETGEYTAPLFKVVSITLLSSWVLSITILPYLCSLFMKPHKQENKINQKFYQKYRRLLLYFIRNPLISIGSIFLLLIVSFSLTRFIPKIFFPPTDKAQVTVRLNLPIGSSIEKTESVVSGVEDYLKSHWQQKDKKYFIKNWSTYIGEGGPRFVLNYAPMVSSPEFAFMLINLNHIAAVPLLIKQLEEFCLQNYPDLVPTIKAIENGPPIQSPISIRIQGKNLDKLYQIVAQAKQKLKSIPGSKNVSDNWGERSKKILVNIDSTRAKRVGLTNKDIAISLQTSLSGFKTTQFRKDSHVLPVLLKDKDSHKKTLAQIELLNVTSHSTGRTTPLKQVADLEVVWQPSKILRRGQTKTIAVESELTTGYTANEVLQNFIPWLQNESKNWPHGFQFEIGGSQEKSAQSNAAILAKLPIAVLFIVFLLVGQFNSIRKSLIILITIPLGLIGSIWGLLITGSYFGFMTLLGIISLAGIVVNNAIVLIDRIQLEKKVNGHNDQEAILQAAQTRLRPILLTTFTTVGGLIPLWLGGGLMWEPMAIAIIFGLIFSTILTLGVIPLLYSLFFKIKF